MTTLKALNIEIVNILDKITEEWSHMTPIDQLIILKNKLNNPTFIDKSAVSHITNPTLF